MRNIAWKRFFLIDVSSIVIILTDLKLNSFLKIMLTDMNFIGLSNNQQKSITSSALLKKSRHVNHSALYAAYADGYDAE